MTTSLVLAANQGPIGGGEVMLLAMADAARQAGHRTAVLAPVDAEVLRAARLAGHEARGLGGSTRGRYAVALAAYRCPRGALLWCNGLLPALATTGRRNRVVHLHQEPVGPQRSLARIARVGSRATVVPSRSMAERVPGAVVLANWTQDVAIPPAATAAGGGPVRLGYLGRVSRGKGVGVLVAALRPLLDAGRELELLVAGEPRFVDPAEAADLDRALESLGGAVDRRGWIPREEFFASVSLAVFPSVAPESFGLVVAEAMAARVPCVISDAGALPEVAGPEHPWVARAGDSVDLARVIAVALDVPAARRAEHVAAARMRWEREFSPAAGAARFLSLLEDLGRGA